MPRSIRRLREFRRRANSVTMFDGKSIIRHTADELAEAAERGRKKLAEERERIDEVVEGEPDYELLRRKVLAKISAIRTGKSEKIDPALVPDMIPFKKWRMAVIKSSSSGKSVASGTQNFLPRSNKLPRSKYSRTLPNPSGVRSSVRCYPTSRKSVNWSAIKSWLTAN